MGRATPNPKFPSKVWDGTTPSTPTLDTFRIPDGDLGARYRAEILALEQVLQTYLEVLEKLRAPGPRNSVLGVHADGTDLEYKELLAGAGIIINHSTGAITLEATAFPSLDAEADEPVTVGTPLYMPATGHVANAQANTLSHAHLLGLSINEVTATLTCQYLTEGQVTRSDWTPITGVADLSPGVVYYLDAAAPGRLTQTAPTNVGQLVVRAGRAVSARSFDIEIDLPILL